MAVRIRLTRSGGIAGITMVASVDLDTLPRGRARKVRTALARIDFDAPPPPAGRRRGAADTFQYDLVVTNGERRSLTAYDPVENPALRALLDLLLPLARPE